MSSNLTPARLTDILRRNNHLTTAVVVDLTAWTIGAEVGFLDSLSRLAVTYDRPESGAPSSLVLKASSADETYRRIGKFYDAYEREFKFYDSVARRSPIRLPKCFGHEIDPSGQVHLLLLEDLGSLTPGDQVAGVTSAQARAVAQTIGRFHAAWWESPELQQLTWMPARNIQPARYRAAWPRFREVVGSRLPLAALALGDYLEAEFESLLAEFESAPHTIAHSDLRADNLLFDSASSDAPVVVLDWQLAIRGKGILDVARFLGGSVPTEIRIADEMVFLRDWHETLVAGGVKDYSLEQAVRDYRLSSLICLYYPVTIHEAEEHAGSRGAALARVQIDRFFSAAAHLWDGSSR